MVELLNSIQTMKHLSTNIIINLCGNVCRQSLERIGMHILLPTVLNIQSQPHTTQLCMTQLHLTVMTQLSRVGTTFTRWIINSAHYTTDQSVLTRMHCGISQPSFGFVQSLVPNWSNWFNLYDCLRNQCRQRNMFVFL